MAERTSFENEIPEGKKYELPEENIIELDENSELLKSVLNENISNKMLVEELLISSFIPEGYLNEKHLDIKVAVCNSRPRNLLNWRKLIAIKLYNTEKEYINNMRRIDEKYLKKLVNFIKKYKK